MEILIFEGGTLPKKMTDGAVCYDVYAREIEQISNDLVHVKIGFAATPPDGYKIVLVPRSSLTKTTWLVQNSPGQGDEDYTDEYQFRFRAIPTGVVMVSEDGEWKQDSYGNEVCTPRLVPKLTYDEFPYKVGDRVGQIYLEKVEEINFNEVKQLKQTNRKGGFGST